MSSNGIFKRKPYPYKKPTEAAKENVNMEKTAQTPNTSVNGVNHSGKHYQTTLQYGDTNSLKSAMSQNGGASVINISIKAEAVKALSDELQDLEKLQLEVGEKMAILVYEQMRLAEKCRAINKAMESMLK